MKIPVSTDKLPALEGVTSETVYNNMKALHEARKAYIVTDSDDSIHHALRHKVRVNERPYQQGEKVYYERDKGHWQGPETVIGNDGGVYSLCHQGSVV